LNRSVTFVPGKHESGGSGLPDASTATTCWIRKSLAEHEPLSSRHTLPEPLTQGATCAAPKHTIQANATRKKKKKVNSGTEGQLSAGTTESCSEAMTRVSEHDRPTRTAPKEGKKKTKRKKRRRSLPGLLLSELCTHQEMSTLT
jgi:hypothetical protein